MVAPRRDKFPALRTAFGTQSADDGITKVLTQQEGDPTGRPYDYSYLNASMGSKREALRAG